MNTFTNFGASVTSDLVFQGFVANSIGMQVAETQWGRTGSQGVYVATVSGVAVDDVANILGFANRQSVTGGSVLVSFDQIRGFQFVVHTYEESASEFPVGPAYAERSGARLAADMDSKLFTTAVNGASNVSAGGGSSILAVDITDALQALDADNVPTNPRSWVFDPEGRAFLYQMTTFIDASARGDGKAAAVVTGQVGTLFGNPVFMSQNMPSAASLLIYRPSLALGINRDLEVNVGRVPGNFGTTYEGHVRFGTKVIDGNGLCVLNNY